MVELQASSIHSNTVGIFGQLIVGVKIRAPVNPSITFFPRLSMHTNILRASLWSIIYLVTVEEVPVSSNYHIKNGMVFMVDIWEASSHDYEVSTLGRLIVGVMILDPSFPASHCFPRVIIIMAEFMEDLLPMLHLDTLEVVMYPANKYLLCKFYLFWCFDQNPNTATKS